MQDDPDIPDDDLLLRRIKRVPDCLIVNLVTKRYELKPNALRFDEGSGLSAHSDRLLSELGVPRSHLCDWTTHTAIEFEAGVPRGVGGGVVHEPDMEDAVKGGAHMLVRGSAAKPPREEKKAMRDAIAHNCRFMPEDPTSPDRQAS